MPPPTPRVAGSKKLWGERVTLPGTRVDRVLFDRLQGECRELSLSASDAMQRVLWLHFGKPLLSFQTPDPTTAELNPAPHE